MNRYETLSINDIRATYCRLWAAYKNPRCANRMQVGEWLAEAGAALQTALGLA